MQRQAGVRSEDKRTRVRASGPRSRVGCLTCKLRRVKCGEERLVCARCSKSGVLCEGYLDQNSNEVIGKNKTKQKTLTRRVVPILPRTVTDVSSIPALRDPRNSIAAFPNPFRDSRQYMYFLHFKEDTVRHLTGPIDEGLWTQVSLQAGYDEPLLMQLIIAAGALGKSRKMALTDPDTRVHKQNAFINYGQALKTIQRRVNGSNPVSPRIIMISSLLIYYLENSTGEVETACAHMRKALPLVHDQLSLRGYKYRHCRPSSSTGDLEDSIVAAFVRLDNILCANPDLWGDAGGEQVLKVDYNILQIPLEFKSLQEARNYLETTQFYGLPKTSRELSSTNPSKRDPAAIELMRAKVQMTQEWERAFEPLYQNSTALQADGSRGKDYFAAAMLRVQICAGRVLLDAVLQEPTLNLSASHHRSMDVLDLSKEIADDPDFVQTFAFGHSVVPSVFFVLMARVDMQVERKALKLLTNLAERRSVTGTGGRGKKTADNVDDFFWATKYLEHWRKAEGARESS